MRNSLRKKYTFIGVGLILAFLLMSLLFNWLFKEQFLIWENHRKMESVCAQLGEWIDKDSGELQRKIEELGFEENVKISVFNSNYEIVAATQPQRELSGSVNRKLVQKLKEMWGILDETGFYFEQGKREDRDYPYLIQAKKMGDSGYVVVRKSIPALQKDMATMDIFYVLSGGVTLAVGSVIIVCLVGRMVRPLIDMNRVTRKIAKLDFGEAVQVKSEDEIGMLAASINS
ncbi:MAG: HAMP domain-containing protein, partial [Blautia sp.]